MADTPLHEHEAVKHLMGTEHWPKDMGPLVFRYDAVTGSWGWQDPSDGEFVQWWNEPSAHSLITIAAVRALWAKDYAIRSARIGGEPVAFADNDFANEALFFRAPTEPLAILAAYQATVMGKESSK